LFLQEEVTVEALYVTGTLLKNYILYFTLEISMPFTGATKVDMDSAQAQHNHNSISLARSRTCDLKGQQHNLQ
jgi:hypothetical protein